MGHLPWSHFQSQFLSLPQPIPMSSPFPWMPNTEAYDCLPIHVRTQLLLILANGTQNFISRNVCPSSPNSSHQVPRYLHSTSWELSNPSLLFLSTFTFLVQVLLILPDPNYWLTCQLPVLLLHTILDTSTHNYHFTISALLIPIFLIPTFLMHVTCLLLLTSPVQTL